MMNFLNYLAKNCGYSQFECKSDKTCISLYYRCNGFTECYDGSDEQDCDSMLINKLFVS